MEERAAGELGVDRRIEAHDAELEQIEARDQRGGEIAEGPRSGLRAQSVAQVGVEDEDLVPERGLGRPPPCRRFR